MIDSTTLASAIQTQIADTVEKSVEQYVENIVRALAMDDNWIAKMEQQISESVARKFGQKLSSIDVNTLVLGAVEPAISLYFERHRAAGHGIDDQATSTQLTLKDDTVEVQKNLLAKELTVSGDAIISQTLTVQNLAVRGTINTDNRTWQTLSANIAQLAHQQLNQTWREQIMKDVADSIKKDGISFENIRLDGQDIVSGDCLASSIRRSSLTQLGTLDSLRVNGSTDLGDSLSVRPRRVGINTQHPDMALAVWDEEVALVLGKHKEQTAYIGTLRPQTLVIGVNRSPAVTINDSGQVTLQHLTVGRHRICHEPECPNYSGTKGDIVFNSNPKNDGVWGWQCLGAYKWIPLRTA